MDQAEKKAAAAQAALEFVTHGIVGVGTGSTVNCFIDALAQVKDRVEGAVSSSDASTERLNALGVPLLDLNDAQPLDVYVDGADEANEHLQLIKGGGGALTREKIVAAASARFVCIVDDSKLVGMLGKFPLPVEVLPMAQAFVSRKFVKMRANPVWRENFVTDNGNHILDVHDLAISNPLEMEDRLNRIPGILTVGLFANRPADILLIGNDDGVRELRI